MEHVSDRRRFLYGGVVGTALGAISGCGTVLHPERRGQPAGPLDWKIVALDAVGLLLFFVPGVIAFAVDFSNGTIYLPPGSHAGMSDRTLPNTSSEPQLTSISVAKDQLSLREIERVVTQHSGREVQLKSGSYETQPLDSIDRFWIACRRIASVQRFVRA